MNCATCCSFREGRGIEEIREKCSQRETGDNPRTGSDNRLSGWWTVEWKTTLNVRKGANSCKDRFQSGAHELLFIAGRAAAETLDHALFLLCGISPFAGGGCRLRPAPTGADAKCVLEQINKTLNGAAPVLPLASRLLYLEVRRPHRTGAPHGSRACSRFVHPARHCARTRSAALLPGCEPRA